MTLTVKELAALVGGQFALEAQGGVPITGGASIAEAGTGHVTFFGNIRYLPALRTSGATAALVPLDFAEDVPPIAIRVENPSLAFAKVLEVFAPTPVVYAAGVHPTAVIGKNVTLGEGVSIQPCAVVEDGARIGAGTVLGAHAFVGTEAAIGANCTIHPRVTVAARCIVGDRVILHSGAVLGSDGFGFEFSNGRHVKVPQTGIVQLDDDVEIGANTTIDRARFGRTWIGEGTKVDNLVQIGHNVVIGKHCIIVSQTGISGSTRVGDYVTFGGQAATVGHIEIGSRATIGARGGVSKSVREGEILWGSPVAMPIREAKEQLALIRRLPKLYQRVKKLEAETGSAVSTEENTPPAT